MQAVKWNQFAQEAESMQNSFEDLCMFLCCRELGVTSIEAYQNQPGIETEPFEAGGKKYGFQVKFFDGGFDWRQIEESIGKAINSYPELDKIFIFSNKDRTRSAKGKTKAEINLETKAKKKKIELEFVTDKSILLKLGTPANFDLAQLYFGRGDEFGFIKNGAHPKMLTVLQSSEYLELPFDSENQKSADEIPSEILAAREKVFLISGHPGSGKSVFMHKSLQVFGGLDKASETEMVRVLTVNDAVPVLVNLKICATDSLESVLRNRKNDSRVNNQTLKFIYLFDGLDELLEENAENVLAQIHELLRRSETKKIILSCRSGNPNRLRAKNYFDEILEYKIANLEEKFIDEYFAAKEDEAKIENLQNLKQVNPSLVKEVKDVFLVKLLWDTIETLDESSTIIDLLARKIDSLLDDPGHRKNIENLNLPNSKKEQIILLNREISYKFHKKFQFRLPQHELQKLILNQYERLDYKSVNQILNYIADLFFENSPTIGAEESNTFIYQHRRYQEYFFAQKLKEEYERDPGVLRELNIVSNREFFEDVFLRYVRREYEKRQNLAGLIELNLIDVYLGKHEAYGADEPYYLESDEFVPSLASQTPEVFNKLLEDENLRIKDKIPINFDSLATFHKTGKHQIFESQANRFRHWIVEKAADETEAEYKNRRLYEEFENFLYDKIVVQEKDVKQVFENWVRGNYENVSESPFRYGEHGKEKLAKSFLRACLRGKPQKLFELIESFDEFEFVAFLDVLRTISFLPIFVCSRAIHRKIKSFVGSFAGGLNTKNSFVLFFKKYFKLTLTAHESDFALSEISRLRKERPMDWQRLAINRDYALLSYALGANSFEAFLKQECGYYDELGLYAALFRDYLDLLNKRKSLAAVAGDYLRFLASRTKRGYYDGPHLGAEISQLWARMFAESPANRNSKALLKRKLIKRENDIFPFAFFLELNVVDPRDFQGLINESDLREFEQHLVEWNDDFSSYVNTCFQLARLFAELNPNKARLYITKALNEGNLRHGWRKDTIVSYLLVAALEILWSNNWTTAEKLKQYTDDVFRLTLRLDEITDGKETWRGPYNVVELIAKYDVEFAEDLKNRLVEKKPSHNFPNLAVASVLIGKANYGIPFADIERGMLELQQRYDYQGRPESDYHEHRIKIYLSVAECDLYPKEIQKQAFEKICAEYEEMQSHNLSYYLSDRDFKNEKLKIIELCKKYRRKLDIAFDGKGGKVQKQPKMSEGQFVQAFKKATTQKKIDSLYLELHNSHNNITVSKLESWETLIQKTLEIFGNITPFTDFLKEKRFPHYGYFSNEYLHLGLAAALKNPDSKQEIIRYLSENTGHGGFLNVMKAFEAIGDGSTCVLLFERYLRICNFLAG